MNESQKQLCAELWERYEPQLRKVCNIKLAGPKEDKDEILSEVFLILCKKIDQEGEIEYPQAWLYGTLNNLLKQKYTENSKSKVTYVAKYSDIGLPYEYDPLDEIFDRETLEELRDILERYTKERTYRRREAVALLHNIRKQNIQRDCTAHRIKRKQY